MSTNVCAQPDDLSDTINTDTINMGFNPISGLLPSLIKKTDKPYIVTSSIEIPEGEEVVIEKGVIFLFKNFTGLNIKGTLHAEGTGEEPIVFTSENDTTYNPSSSIVPAPFDWDGITIYAGESSSILENCSIMYSVFGIKSLTKAITIMDCNFSQNGNTDFTIEGKEQLVESSPYSYNISDLEGGKTDDIEADLTDLTDAAIQDKAIQDAAVQNKTIQDVDVKEKTISDTIPMREKVIPEDTISAAAAPLDIETTPEKKETPIAETMPSISTKAEKPKPRKRITLRVLSSVSAVFAGAIGIRETMLYISEKDYFNEINDFSHENRRKYTSEEWESARDNMNRHLIYMHASYGIALLGICVFIISF